MSEFIVCYDISDPKRLGRLHRFLKKCAVPLQYSVFLFSGDDRQLDRLLEKATGYIDPKADDLRAYPLPTRGFKARLGKPALPEGIQWSGLPTAW
ncbi:CRISPR-associated endonuclease Cas2 [Methyloversatilis sp.]|uniref:CRISPR-associated endonuclease Cas2 n=1 Tax=Methyloversatilis sp. TaxID=2569862 RepID=UPI0035AE03C1